MNKSKNNATQLPDDMTPAQRRLSKLYQKRPAFELRPYQNDCIQAITSQPIGSKMLVVMATGLGKTATFTHIPRQGKKMLIITAGKELVTNPLGYFDCPVGVEMAEFDAKRDFPDAEVICASAPSLVTRLSHYDPKEFGIIIIDEAHHAPAKTFRTCIDYFKPDYLIGFTATPKRRDNVRLDDIFDKIVFSRDLWWGIEHGYLSDVYTRRVQINIDLRRVKKTINSVGELDFNANDLAAAMVKSTPAIVSVYYKYAFGPTVINVASVAPAYDVASHIPGAIPITGEMPAKDREQVLSQFRAGNVPCIVNVSVLKEGVDIPNVVTIIMARPTLSESLYIQLAGRGLRIWPGKKYLNLIDIEGIVPEGMTLCSALTLSGIDMNAIPPAKRHLVNETTLTEIEKLANELADAPQNWIFNAQFVDSWASASGYDIHGVNWFMLPDGHFELRFSDRDADQRYLAVVPAADALGQVSFGCVRMPLQIALDLYRDVLDQQYGHRKILWDRDAMKTWAAGSKPASEKQIRIINSYMPDYDTTGLTVPQASQIISRLISDRYKDDDDSIRIYPVDPDTAPEHFSQVETFSEGKETRNIYSYDPGPEYKLNVSRKKLSEDFCRWLEGRIELGYHRCGDNIDLLIERVNGSKRSGYATLFFSQCPEYRYLCQMDGKNISRRELMMWLAHVADAKLPRIIYKVCIQCYESESSEHIPFSLKQPPLNRITFEFQESRKNSGRKKALPETAAEARTKAMEKWAKENQAGKKKKRGRPPKRD
ncbi:MAG: DEAD/DEAH box helicase [Candidatus Coprenecus sp.]